MNEAHRPKPRPHFDHPGGDHSWTANYPRPVLFMTALLGFLAAAGPLTAIAVANTMSPSPARTAAVFALPALSLFALVGMIQLFKRRNGGRALAFLLSLAPLAAFVFLTSTGAIGVNEYEAFDSFLSLVAMFAFLVAGAVQPFRKEGRDWLAKPLGHYQGEGDELRTQIPFPLALALAALWIGITATLIGAPLLLADPAVLTGLARPDLDTARQILWTLLPWALLQALLCLLIAHRNNTARRLTAASALLATPAGAALGLLVWQWTGSNTQGAATGALLAAGALTCWILLTHNASAAWCTEPTHPHHS